MSSYALIKLAVFVALCMVVSVPIAYAITCDQVSHNLVPCLDYLRNCGAVPEPCCRGISNLNDLGRTTAERRTICNCLKQNAPSLTGVNPTLAEELPAKCGVNVPYKISPNPNCANVQ